MSLIKLGQQNQSQNANEELMSYSSALEHIKKIKPEAYVLLTSRVKNLYLQALTQEKWKKEVCAQYGEAVWQALETQRVNNRLSAVTHQHQTVSVDCEKLQLSHQALTADQIVKASQTMEQISSGIQNVLSAIIAEATDLLTNDEALYKAYQAFDHWPDSMSEVDLEETLPTWKTEVLEKVDWISRLLDRFSNSYHLFKIDFIRLIQLIHTPYAVEKLKQNYPKRSFTVNYFQETFNLLSQSQELPADFDTKCKQWESLLKERITDLEQQIQSDWDSKICSILIQNLNNQSTLRLVYNETEQAQTLLAKSLKLCRKLVDKEDTDESNKRLAQTLRIIVDLATANEQKEQKEHKEHKEQTLLYARECLALNQSLTKSLKKQKMQKEDEHKQLCALANSWDLIALLSPDEKEVLQARNEQVRIYQNLYNKDQSIDHLLGLIRANINLSYPMRVQRNALAYPYFELLKEKIEKEPNNSMEELCINLDHLDKTIKENGDLHTYLGMQDSFCLELDLSLELDDFPEEKRNIFVKDVITIAKEILNDEKVMGEAVLDFAQTCVAKKYERVLYNANYQWNNFGGRLKIPLSYYDSKLSVVHIKKLIAKSQEEQEDQGSEQIQDLAKDLLKLPLAQRNEFVNNSLTPQLEEYHAIIRALQQLGHGRHSAFYTLPILDYSPELVSLIRTEGRKLQELFQSLPHLQDIQARSKARKQSQISYEIKELPKNPLDIDFGRDSGCCVQVEKEGEIKGNGFTVPSFLLSESIRLFAIYQIKASGKKQRVGFINGFDAEIYLDKSNLVKPLQGKILALNSVELSSSNVAGGYQSIESIIEYVKTWMTQYIQQSPQAYIGVSMGDLYYNHACRQQTPLNDYLQVDLTIPKYYKPIYSDIITKELGEQKTKNEYRISQLNSYWWINPCAYLGLSDLKLSDALSEFLRYNHYLTLGTLLSITPETLIHQGLDQVLLKELKQILGSLSLSLGQAESVSNVA